MIDLARFALAEMIIKAVFFSLLLILISGSNVLPMGPRVSSAQEMQLSNEIPSSLIGLFSNKLDKTNHIRALWNIFELPADMSLSVGNAFSFDPLGEMYQYCVWFQNEFQTNRFNICIPFRLNAKGTFKINQDTLDVMFILMNGVISVVIRKEAKSELIMTFASHEQGVLVSFNGRADILYKRSIYPYMFGTFQLDMDRTDAKTLEKANALFQAINITDKWTLNASLSLIQGSFHKENEFSIRQIASPVPYQDMELVLYPNYTLFLNGQHYFTMTTSRLSSTLLYVPRVDGGKRSLTFDFVFSPDDLIQTIGSENDEVHLIYKRSVPWFYFGTYEEANNGASKSPSLSYFDWKPSPVVLVNTTNDTSCDDVPVNRRVKIFQDSISRNYVYQDGSCKGGMYNIQFQLGRATPLDVTNSSYANATVTARSVPSGDRILDLNFYGSNTSNSSTNQTAPSRHMSLQLVPVSTDPLLGLRVMFYLADEYSISRAIGRFRRVVSPLVMGRFRYSNDSASNDTQVEISQIGDNVFRRVTSRNQSTVQTQIFTFNRPFRISDYDQKSTNVTVIWHYMEMNGNVVVKAHRVDTGGQLDIDSYIFSPEGITLYSCATFFCKASGTILRVK
ncbi:uncharacterized protein LOC129592243 isoform X2 [Paramacrobiotus metropolitanus]|uniref:uncharacterized protein LOC129592243 isoform X2 n=1 Tax=Paramacrobiotus metropolitanus TaxID=2943436 RepID=UPI002446419B|nr:uncharacterized protein LOC129592243 isoform X2 [Paramacrobiotus metropolitanus]